MEFRIFKDIINVQFFRGPVTVVDAYEAEPQVFRAGYFLVQAEKQF
jgi:hypothetical protein